MEASLTQQTKKSEITQSIVVNQPTLTNNLPISNDVGSNNLKSKLNILEEKIKEIAIEMAEHKKEVTNLKNQKDRLQETLRNKTAKVTTNLLQDIDKVEDEMKKHFAHQTSENGRLQQKITSLKSEKTSLQNQLIALQRRISDLEMQIGSDDIKF